MSLLRREHVLFITVNELAKNAFIIEGKGILPITIFVIC
jgi:hypothetical protein